MTSPIFRLATGASSTGPWTWAAYDTAVDTAAGTWIKVELQSSAVSMFECQVITADDITLGSLGLPAATIDQATKTAVWRVPVAAPYGTWIVWVRVNGGLDANDVASDALHTTLAVHVLTPSGNRLIACGETDEASRAYGYTPKLNKGLLGGGIGNLAGDCTGPSGGNTVIRIQGYDISNAVPGASQALIYNGGTGKWTPTTISYPAQDPALGKDCSGTCSNATVVAIQGNAVLAGVPANAQIFTWVTANNRAEWKDPVAPASASIYDSVTTRTGTLASAAWTNIGAVFALTADKSTAMDVKARFHVAGTRTGGTIERRFSISRDAGANVRFDDFAAAVTTAGGSAVFAAGSLTGLDIRADISGGSVQLQAQQSTWVAGNVGVVINVGVNNA